MGEVDARVLAHARERGGVFTRSEALAIGMSARTLQRRVADGSLVRFGGGMLALPGVLESEHSILRAATSALNAVASHESAARLNNLSGLKDLHPVVSVPIRRSNRFEAVRVHQLTDLEPDHTTEIEGIPVTTPARTIVDLSAVLPPKVLADVADQAIRRGLTTYDHVAVLHTSLARRGKPGTRALRNLLNSRLGAKSVGDSVLESRLFDLIVSGGLPLPQRQFRPEWLRMMNGRVDFAYIDAQLIVEGDSRRWHDNPDAFQLDRNRDNLAQLAGWRILRFTWEDISTRPDYVLETIGSALASF